MSITALLTVSFDGRNGPGTISVPELKAGDILLSAGLPGTKTLTSNFCPLVSTDGELEQAYPGDESANTYTAVFFRQS